MITTCTMRERQEVVLTVYLRGNRVLSGQYQRRAAAYRLRFSRKLEEFMGHKTEVLK